MVDNTELCLFFLIIGLLLASLLRKPTIEGQETMEKVVPTEKAPPQGKMQFKKMEKNTVCFEGTNITDQAECDRAVKMLKLKEGESITTTSRHVTIFYSYTFTFL
jgi:hypothetical protein